ncbi:MAG: hypothetical protein Q9168_000998 [Polycauliona sp. 1 TL-2023]
MDLPKALDLDRLRTSCELLRLLHFRNKNQHRRSTWWTTLRAVKTCVQKLVIEAEDGAWMRVRSRCSFMETCLLPRCYRSFNQVVSDGQFSVLGVALLAETARIHATIVPVADLVRTYESRTEPQGALRTSPLPPSEAKEVEDVGRLVQRPPLLSNFITQQIPSPRHVPLSQETNCPVIRSLATSEHEKPGKSPKTIQELFRALE